MVREQWVSDSRETALNFALFLVLDPSRPDPKRPFGVDLCRCHQCGRLWLLDRSGKAGKPVRNYHDRQCAKLAKPRRGAERSRSGAASVNNCIRSRQACSHLGDRASS